MTIITALGIRFGWWRRHTGAGAAGGMDMQQHGNPELQPELQPEYQVEHGGPGKPETHAAAAFAKAFGS